MLNEESRKLREVRIVPHIAAVWRYRAHRLVKSANRNGIDKYITPFVVVPMTPVAP